MVAPSLDAIDATKGHCSFLNCVNNDKKKKQDYTDDRPTQWTKELFFNGEAEEGAFKRTAKLYREPKKKNKKSLSTSTSIDPKN